MSELVPEDRFALFAARVLVAAVVVLVIGLLLGALARAAAMPADDSLTRSLSNFTRSHPSFEHAMRDVTLVGSTAFLFGVVATVVLVLLVRRAWWTALVLVAITALGATMCTLVKMIVARPRPPSSLALVHATGKSFPSGHAMNSTIVYGTILVLIARVASPAPRIALAVGGALLVVAISFSRLALGVHHLADVLGGIVLGSLWLAVLMTPIGTRHHRDAAPVRGHPRDGDVP